MDLTTFSYLPVPGKCWVLGMSAECQVQGKGPVACWGFGLEEAGLGEEFVATVGRINILLDLPPPHLLQSLQPHSEATQLAI